ncbi:MAG: apolipoprotein N-acyltransferase [Bacteroidetes bacterium]|nr:MAG: apolipoprotein N-acyltransferase [Bacteroidota bacterium]
MKSFKKAFFYSLLSLLSGILLWASWPERGMPALIFIALTPLLWLEERFLEKKSSGKRKIMFLYYYLGMLTWNFLTTWWIWNSSAVGSIVAIGLNSFFMAVIWQLYFSTRKRYGTAVGYISLIVYWISFEFLHMNWEISWPWLTLGNVFADMTEWVQWYEYTGVLGGSIWVLALNLLIFQLFKNLIKRDLIIRLRQMNSLILASVTVILLFAPVFVSKQLLTRRGDTGIPMEVCIVQPNVDPYNEKFKGTGSEQLAGMLRLSSTVVDSGTSLLVFPETALPDGIWLEELYIHRDILQIKSWLNAYPKLNLLTGFTAFRHYPKGSELSHTARKFRYSEDHFDVYNSALMIRKTDSIQVYHKSRLVPGVEKMPYPAIFGFLEDYAIELGGTSGSLGMQNDRRNFITQDHVKIAPAICYESVYGGFMSAYIRKGAEFLVIVTNDGWWGNTAGYKQHMHYARLRAIEFRKSIARSANTGISCFINQKGEIVSRTKWWEEDAIKGTVYRNNNITFYARYGNYLGFIAAFVSICMLTFMLIKKMIHK